MYQRPQTVKQPRDYEADDKQEQEYEQRMTRSIDERMEPIVVDERMEQEDVHTLTPDEL